MRTRHAGHMGQNVPTGGADPSQKCVDLLAVPQIHLLEVSHRYRARVLIDA